jgi:hypothetical protein
MRYALLFGLHILLFVVALVVFYLGLGVGLALSPPAGTALWLVAGAIALANLLWLIASIRRVSRRTQP